MRCYGTAKGTSPAEPYIKSSNWRVLTHQALWNTAIDKLGKGDLSKTLDYMTDFHVDYVVSQVVPLLITSPPHKPLKYNEFSKTLFEVIKEVLQLKYDAQTRDARYEYSLQIPSPKYDMYDHLEKDTPISCKTSIYNRWEASSDSNMSRVFKKEKEATYHTAGDAGWVAKPKKS